jgi:peptidoglycan-N-acetylglucosamine deacetylase
MKYKRGIALVLGLVGIVISGISGCSSGISSETGNTTGSLMIVKKASAATLNPNKSTQDKKASAAGLPDFSTKVPLGKLIANIPYPQHPNTVYLTFDDGPSNYTKEIVATLDNNQIKGSFFWIGDNLASWSKDPSNLNLAHYMVQDGLMIGSHTMKHTGLGHKSLAEQINLIQESTNFVAEKIGHPVYYFRPPYGSVDQITRKASMATKQIIAYWDVDSLDWKYQNDPDKFISNILTEVKPGDIIIMHEKDHTAEMLQKVIDTLKGKGYQFAALPTPQG